MSFPSILILLSLSLFPTESRARDYDTYRSDYFKGAFCTTIGGACAGDDDMVTAIFQNPAGLVNGQSRWDFDGDYASRDLVEPGARGNNGAADTSAVGGVAYSPGKWAAGLGFSWRRSDLDSPAVVTSPSGSALNTRLLGRGYTTLIRIPLAYYFDNGASIGISLSHTTYYQELELADPTMKVTSSPGSSKVRVTVGAQLPAYSNMRLGSWLRLPITLEEHVAFTSPVNGQETYREEFTLHYPWIWGTGAAWKISAGTVIFAETDVIGPTPDGFLFSYKNFTAASAPERVEKGRKIVIEPHVGARVSLSERVRAHLGSYFENARWQDARGRAHGTLGLSFSLLGFEWIAGVDVARSYTQLFFTFR